MQASMFPLYLTGFINTTRILPPHQKLTSKDLQSVMVALTQSNVD